jgi:hypothetical protein
MTTTRCLSAEGQLHREWIAFQCEMYLILDLLPLTMVCTPCLTVVRLSGGQYNAR